MNYKYGINYIKKEAGDYISYINKFLNKKKSWLKTQAFFKQFDLLHNKWPRRTTLSGTCFAIKHAKTCNFKWAVSKSLVFSFVVGIGQGG